MPTVVVKKTWVGDESALQNRPSSVQVVLLRNSQQYDTQTLNSQNGWTYTWNNLSSYYTWTVREAISIPNYETTYEESQSGGSWNRTYTFDITNTYVAPQPTYTNVLASVRFYNDLDYRDWLRPKYVTITLKKNGDPYDSIRIGDGFEWNWTWENLSLADTWTIEAEDLYGYTAQITQDGTDFQILYQCTYTPPDPPDPSPGNHPTKDDYDLMYSVLYDDISAENAKSIIHILDYGNMDILP